MQCNWPVVNTHCSRKHVQVKQANSGCYRHTAAKSTVRLSETHWKLLRQVVAKEANQGSDEGDAGVVEGI